MKKLIVILSILTLFTGGVFSLRPKTDYEANFLEVTGTERNDSSLRVSVVLKHLPGYWINLPQNDIFLAARNDTTRKYRLIGSENIELGKRTWIKESGRHEGTLIFEKIPADVDVLDMLETEDSGNNKTMISGLSLNENIPDGAPDMIDIKSLSGSMATYEWEGLDPGKYKDIPYYTPNGKAHVKGRLNDYHPVAGYSTLKIYTTNAITGSRDEQTETLNPDGTFAFDLYVAYPQYCMLEIGDMPYNHVFVVPGDTIDIVTTARTDFLNWTKGYRKYFGYSGKINDATAVNLLTDSLRSRSPIGTLFQLPATDSLPGSIYSGMVGGLYEFLKNIPVSTYAKDLVATKALTEMISFIHRNEWILSKNQGPDISEDSVNFIGVKQLLCRNPLTISANNHFLYSADPIWEVEETDSVTQSAENSRTSFIQQLQIAKSLIESIDVFTLHTREAMNKSEENVAQTASIIDYPALNQAILSAYTDLVEEIVKEENSSKKKAAYTLMDVGKDSDVLEEIIRPYLGNLIYIDFWGLHCSPCRMNMIDQKKIIKPFEDQPFKVLYVADDSNVAESNQWLEKNEIEGERIYLSSDNWKRISEYFNFNQIPFGVLIGKDAELIKTHFSLIHPQADKEIKRHLQLLHQNE